MILLQGVSFFLFLPYLESLDKLHVPILQQLEKVAQATKLKNEVIFSGLGFPGKVSGAKKNQLKYIEGDPHSIMPTTATHFTFSKQDWESSSVCLSVCRSVGLSVKYSFPLLQQA